jgi:hypothetical protein
MSYQTILFYLSVIVVVFACVKIYYDSDAFQLKCIISGVDGKKYCIRERAKMNDAADLLAAVTNKCQQMVDYLSNKYPEDDRVKRLVQNFKPDRIRETLPTSELTAYSENKGAKIAFCLNKYKDGSALIDINTLTFVALHELSHLTTVSVGHHQDFWDSFKFILGEAKTAGIYQPEDYKKTNREYCGLTLTDNPLFDL